MKLIKDSLQLVLVISILSFSSILFVKGCQKAVKWSDNHRAKIQARDDYSLRFPVSGDTVELNGQKIVILKEYFWAANRTYRVRLPDGTVTDIIRAELLDKKPLP